MAAAGPMRGARSGSLASVDGYGAHTGTVADLTASVRLTTGQPPPPLVGASVTVLGSGVYVFGGRLVPTRNMISDLYALDLHTMVWERVWPSTSAIKGKQKAIDDEPSSPAQLAGDSDTLGAASSTPAARSTWTEDTAFEAAQRAHGPKPRYFHSAEAWGSERLIFFGGMGYQVNAQTVQDGVADAGLCVLGDVFVFNTRTREWLFPEPTCADQVSPPAARYAHLCSLNIQVPTQAEAFTPSRRTKMSTPTPKHPDLPPEPSNRSAPTQPSQAGSTTTPKQTSTANGTNLHEPPRSQASLSAAMKAWPKGRNLLSLIGGQDIANQYIHELNVLDLDEMKWVENSGFSQNCGTYRSVACARVWTVREGDELDAPGYRDGADDDDLRRTSWSERPTVDKPEPVYVYSNFNFSDVKRDLELISFPSVPVHDTPSPPSGHTTTLHPLSHTMIGPPLPPGLRFPTGSIVGNSLIVSGTFLSQPTQCFAIWALDLSSGHSDIPGRVPSGKKATGAPDLTWQKIDPGAVTSRGSWNRAAGWKNSLVVIGDRDRDISQDYHHRQLNFKHVALIDLEAFGIYQPEAQPSPLHASRFGLKFLHTPALSDFDLLCPDGQVISCNRRILEDRWPWFKTQYLAYRERARRAYATFRRFSLKEVEGSTTLEGKVRTTLIPEHPPPPLNASTSSMTSSGTTAVEGGSESTVSLGEGASDDLPPSSDLRFGPRSLDMPHHPALVLAFVQYLYAQRLCTPLHRDTHTLSALLVFATSYEVETLKIDAVHALHRALGKHGFHVGNTVTPLIYEAAALSGCLALQIRCLKAFYHVKHLRERMIVQNEASRIKTQQQHLLQQQAQHQTHTEQTTNPANVTTTSKTQPPPTLSQSQPSLLQPQIQSQQMQATPSAAQSPQMVQR